MNAIQSAFYHLSELTNCNSGELITLEEKLDVSLLKRAISLAVRRHPLLNQLPTKKRGKPYWMEMEADLPIHLTHCAVSETDPDKLYPILWNNLWAEPIDELSRQVRFIYTETPEYAYLQICAPHTVTDACSGTKLAADIAQAYTALSDGRTWVAKPEENVTEPLPDVFLTTRTSMQRMLVALYALTEIVTDIFRRGRGLRPIDKTKQGPTGVHVTPVSEALLNRTITVARTVNASAHTLFLLALTRARQEMLGPDGGNTPFRINDFATLRPFASKDLRNTFDVLVVPHQMTIKPSWSDDVAIRKINGQLQSKKQGGILTELYRLSLYSTLARLAPSRWGANMVFKHINKSDMAVTNPGRVLWEHDLSHFGDIRVLDFVNFPNLLPPARVVMIFTTFRDQLRIVQLYDKDRYPEGVEALLAKPFVRHLTQLLDSLETEVFPHEQPVFLPSSPRIRATHGFR